MRSLKLIAVLIFLVLLLPLTTHAASLTGITISPFEQQLTISSDDAVKSFDLTFTNHTSILQELKLTARDFGSLNDTGGVVLSGSSNYTERYGLASWISVGSDTVLLKPDESQKVAVTIENRADLRPGGHYGAVVATVNGLDDSSGNKVVIRQQLLSLLLVNKVGGEHFDLKLKDVTQNGNWLHLPNTVKLKFQNPGNVHVVPRGVVRLKSPSGTVLAQGIINQESAFILPETYRQLYVTLTPVHKDHALPGIYHLDVEYRYDGLNRSATKKYFVKFIALPLITTLLILTIVTFKTARYLKSKPASPKTQK